MRRVNTPPSVSMPSEQRRHVEEQHVLHFALQHRALDGRADGHDFVRVDGAVGFLAEELLHLLEDLGHAGHAADHDHFLDVGGFEAGILEGLAAGLHRALDEVVDEGFQLGARQLDDEMLRAVRSAVMNGRLTSVCIADDSSIFAFSAASFRRCRASLSFFEVDAVLF